MKSFEEIYERVYNSSKDRLKEIKNKNNKFILTVALIAIILNICIYIFAEQKYIVTLTISLSFCLLIVLYVNSSKIYRKAYKDCVIQSLIKEYNDKLYYNQALGIHKVEYTISNFDNNIDEYFSEDKIWGTLKSGEPVQLAEIATYTIERYTDSDGNRKEERTETFRGMYGLVKLEKNINSEIKVSTNYNIKRFNKQRMEIDSTEFEKYYDIFSKDKITAMSIFTSDLIEKYIDIINVSNRPLEIKIKDNLLYFRFRCGQMFEPPTFSDGLNENLIRKYYKMVFYPMEVLQKTVENINTILR